MLSHELMTILSAHEKIESIKHWAEHNRTGTPKELARKLEISESTLYRLLVIMKQLQIKIAYNKWKRSYEIL